MSTWVGVTPLIGAGSLDGFAVGALMSGACSLAIVAPRRGRRRQIAAACHGLALAVGRPEQEGQHARPAAVFGVGSEPVAQPGEPARRGRPVVGRHRLANPDGVLRDGVLRDTVPPPRTSRHAAFPARPRRVPRAGSVARRRAPRRCPAPGRPTPSPTPRYLTSCFLMARPGPRDGPRLAGRGTRRPRRLQQPDKQPDDGPGRGARAGQQHTRLNAAPKNAFCQPRVRGPGLAESSWPTGRRAGTRCGPAG